MIIARQGPNCNYLRADVPDEMELLHHDPIVVKMGYGESYLGFSGGEDEGYVYSFFKNRPAAICTSWTSTTLVIDFIRGLTT